MAVLWRSLHDFTITLRHTTVGRTSLDEWSVGRRDLYLTTHNTCNRETFMPPEGFEPTNPANQWPQNEASDRAAIGTGDNITSSRTELWPGRCVLLMWNVIDCWEKLRLLIIVAVAGICVGKTVSLKMSNGALLLRGFEFVTLRRNEWRESKM